MNRFRAFFDRLKQAVTRFWARLFSREQGARGSLAPPESAGDLAAPPARCNDIADAEYEEIDAAAESRVRQDARGKAEEAERQRALEAQRRADEKAAKREAARVAAEQKAKADKAAREAAKAEERRKLETEQAEAKRKAAEDKAAAMAAAEEAKRRAAEDKAAAMAAAEEAKRKAAEEKAAAKAAAEEAKRKAAEEKAAAKAAAEEAKRKAAEEKAAAKAAAEEAKREATEAEAARLAAIEEAKRQIAEAEAAVKAAEEAKRRHELEAKKAAIQIPTDYQPAPESGHALYQLNLDAFDGPLDLLLFLIRRHQLDIFDIPMAFICERYLEYLKVMEDLNLDVASEFMFMAAELLHIKSKMLLPKPVDVEDEEEEGDPRADLVRRLLEYQKYKDAAEQLDQFHWFGRDIFGREPERIEVDRSETPLKEVSVFALIEAFDSVLARQKPEFRHQVIMEQSSVKERMRRLVATLAGQPPQPFEELIGPIRSRIDIVVTFLALLEMAKMQLMKVFESEGGTLYIAARFADMEVATQQLDSLEEKTLYAG